MVKSKTTNARDESRHINQLTHTEKKRLSSWKVKFSNGQENNITIIGWASELGGDNSSVQDLMQTKQRAVWVVPRESLGDERLHTILDGERHHTHGWSDMLLLLLPHSIPYSFPLLQFLATHRARSRSLSKTFLSPLMSGVSLVCALSMCVHGEDDEYKLCWRRIVRDRSFVLLFSFARHMLIS